ncbi:hypothetical protein D3C80_1094550 [compost metagenome]
MLKNMATDNQVVDGHADLCLRHATCARHGWLFVDVEDIRLVPLPLERGIRAISPTPIQDAGRRRLLKNEIPCQLNQLTWRCQCFVPLAKSRLIMLAQRLIFLTIIAIVQLLHLAITEADIKK